MAGEDHDEGSPTADPLVAWGVWRASKEGGRPAPPAWVVLGFLLGLPAVLFVVVLLAVTTR